MCALDVLMKRVTQLGDRVVAVPCRTVPLEQEECPHGIEPDTILVKFALVPNDAGFDQVFTSDSTWVYSLTGDMNVERYKICQAVERITALEDIQKMLKISNDMLTKVGNRGFYVNKDNGWLRDFNM